jgi:dihydrofolate reductase
MFNHVSIDGCFADAAGGLDWIVQEPAVQEAGAARLGSAGGMLFGRRTFEMFAGYWPQVTDTSTGPHGEPVSPTLRAMARWLNDSPKIVCSATLTTPSWQPTVVWPSLSAERVRALKTGEGGEFAGGETAGGDIMVFGSGTIVSQLTEWGLIDEYQFVVSPVVLASGRRLFDTVTSRTPLERIDSTVFESGVMLVRYRPG